MGHCTAQPAAVGDRACLYQPLRSSTLPSSLHIMWVTLRRQGQGQGSSCCCCTCAAGRWDCPSSPRVRRLHGHAVHFGPENRCCVCTVPVGKGKGKAAAAAEPPAAAAAAASLQGSPAQGPTASEAGSPHRSCAYHLRTRSLRKFFWTVLCKSESNRGTARACPQLETGRGRDYAHAVLQFAKTGLLQG